MAHILEISDGTTTINFVDSSGTSWCLIEDGGLVINPPSKRVTYTGGYLGYSGQVPVDVVYESRTISITFEVVGDDRDDIVDKLIGIGRLLNQVAQQSMYSDRVGSVYLKYQIDTLTNPVYFDIINGDLALPANLMSLESLNWVKNTQDTIKGFELTLKCKPLARGAEVRLSGDPTNLDATDDDYYTNGVTFSAANVNGDVPGPVRVVLVGDAADTGGSPARDHVYIGMRSSYNSNFAHVLEAEDGSEVSVVGGSTTSQSTDYSGDPGTGSGGYAVTWTFTSTVLEPLISWTLTQTQTTNSKGKVRALAVGRFPTTCKYRLRPNMTGATADSPYDWYRPEEYNSGKSTILDMGVIDVVDRPFIDGETPVAAGITFQAKPDTSTSTTVILDALILIPADDYKFRRYDLREGDGPYDDGGFEDVGKLDIARVTDTSGNVGIGINAEGQPMYIDPAVDTRLFVTFEGLDGSSDYVWDPADEVRVWVYHTPYYLNIRGTE